MSNNRQSKEKTTEAKESSKSKFPFKTVLGSQQQLQQSLNQLKKLLDAQNKLAEQFKKQIEKKQRIQLFKQALRQYADPKNQNLTKDTDFDESMVVPVDGDVVKGSHLFSKNCLGCHSLQSQSVTNRQDGPALGMVYSRRSGYDRNFKGYSQQLLTADFFWTKFNLYRFMFNPRLLLKQTRCGILQNPIKSESDRADIIEFLKEYYQEMAKNIKIKVVQSKGYDRYQTEIYKSKERQKKAEMHANQKRTNVVPPQ